MTRPFTLVDVFGTDPFTGNPLAVIADAEGLSTDAMQRITRWLNLSETTFLLPPTDPRADYRVRIFTLARELPFAGHPTLCFHNLLPLTATSSTVAAIAARRDYCGAQWSNSVSSASPPVSTSLSKQWPQMQTEPLRLKVPTGKAKLFNAVP